MNAKRLLEHYENIVDAPDAIAQLRRFVFDLAVRGKLVPQDASDEPASDLLKRIAKDKAQLVKPGGKGGEVSPIEIDPTKFPMVLPAGWVLTRLTTISRRIHYGYTASADAARKDVRMLRITDIQDGAVDWESVPGCLIEAGTVDQYRLERGDILIARTGGTIGKTFLVGDVPVVAVFASYLIRVQGTPNIFDKYLKCFFESPLYWTQLYDGARGTGQPNVNGQTLAKLILPLPPLSEQHRIVAKVDELMALCDRLAAARASREAARDRLTAASLARLNVPDPETFQANARFALDALPALTTRADQIKQLRQTILDLAVRGKLVPQDTEDEPVSLGKIEIDDEPPFKAPPGWRWVPFSAVAAFENGDRSQKYPKRSEYAPSGVPWINTGHIESDGTLSRSTMHYITEEKFNSLGGGKIRPGDLVYCLRGATFGKTAYVDPFERGAIASSLMIIRPGDQIGRRYAFIYLTSPLGRKQLYRFDNGTAQPNLSSASVKKYLIPLPPLAEQHRIVTKVDALMALCDQLGGSLATSAETRRRLLDALIAEALAPTEGRAMEAAE